MQFQSDILNLRVVRPKIQETTALGAAYLAGLSTKYWASKDDIRSSWQLEKAFNPEMPTKVRATHVRGWNTAVESTRKFKFKFNE